MGSPFKGYQMAIKLSDYETIPKTENIKIHKNNNRKFLFRFKMKVWDIKKGQYINKQFSKVFTVKATNHSRKDNIKTAKAEFITFREETENNINGNNSKVITLDNLFIKFMETQPLSNWTHQRQHIYDLYIGNSGLSNITKEASEEIAKKREAYSKYKIGHLYIQDIIPHQIEVIISKMKSEHGLSDRRCKSILEVLNPLFKFALKNKLLDESPTEFIKVKIASQKKPVVNATETFKRIYRGIDEWLELNKVEMVG
jgi:hypothetical protein